MAISSVERVDKSYLYWRGGLSILIGILVLVWPGLTVLTFVTLLSIWLFLLGVISVVQGVTGIGKGGHWIASILVGLLELGIGAYLVQRPGLTALTIVTLIGFALLVQGFAYLMSAFLDPAITSGRRVLNLLLSGLSIVAGIWVWRYPIRGGLAYVWLLGLYAMASGAVLIALASSVDEK